MSDFLEVYDLAYNKLAILNDNTLFSAKNIQTSFALNEIPTLSFTMPLKSDKWKYVINENLIKYKSEFFFIKSPNYIHEDSKIDIRVECRHLCSGLEGIQNGEISEIGKTATELIKTVLKESSDGSTLSGWKFGSTNVPSNKFRALESNEQSIFSNLIKIAEIFNASLQFNSTTRTVDLLDIQTDRNIQIRKGKNLKQLNIKYDSNELVTRLYVFGGQDETTNNEINIISVNPTGKSYIEDYSYFTNQAYSVNYINAHPELFLREMTWRASDYINPQQLYDDAFEKMKTLSKPKVTCSVEGVDLSIFPQYFIESPKLGEKIYIYDEDLDLVISAKVTKITRDSENPLSMKIEISNEIEYSSMIKTIVDSSNVVKKVITPQQQILGQYIKEATIGTVQIDDASITNAKISSLVADRIKSNKIDVTDLTANQIFVDKLNSVYATIDYLSSTYATITSLSTLKLSATNIDNGILNTNLVKIQGANGRMVLNNNRLQVFDYPNADMTKPLFERVSLGDVNGDGTKYGLRIRGADGTTSLIDESGVTKEGFTSGYNKLTDNSLNPAKLDIGAVITRINSDNTTTITGSKVYLDNETLDVKMSNLQNKVDDTEERIGIAETNITSTANAITLKASQTDLNTTNTNVSNLTVRVASAEQKITPDAIISTVSNTITTATNNALSNANTYTNLANKVLTIDNTKDTLFHFDKNLCSTNGINPNSGYVATLRNGEGKFGNTVGVEEGTTNWLSSISLDTDWSLWSHWIGTTYWDTKEQYQDSVMGKVFHGTKSAVTSTYLHAYNLSKKMKTSTAYTFSMYIKVKNPMSSNLSFSLHDGNWANHINLVKTYSLTNEWQRVAFTLTTGSVDCYDSIALNIDVPSSIELWATMPQIEEKSFATSYVNGTRANGVLQYDSSIIDLNEGTFMCWFKPSAGFFVSSWTRVFGHSTNTNYNEIELMRSGGTSNLSFDISDNLGNSTNSWYGAKSTTSLSVDTWYHVGCYWSKTSGEIGIYINGVKEATKTGLIASNFPTVKGLVAIGNHPSTVLRVSNSLIDEAFLSKRVLSSTEVKAIYDLQQPFYDPNPKIITPKPNSVTMTII